MCYKNVNWNDYYENSSIPILITREDFVVITANQSCTRLLQANLNEIQDIPIYEIKDLIFYTKRGIWEEIDSTKQIPAQLNKGRSPSFFQFVPYKQDCYYLFTIIPHVCYSVEEDKHLYCHCAVTQDLLDGFSFNMVLIDKCGEIIMQNRSWLSSTNGCYSNYLEYLQTIYQNEGTKSNSLAQEIRSLLKGEKDSCSSIIKRLVDDTIQWYAVECSRLASMDAVLLYEVNINDIKDSEKNLIETQHFHQYLMDIVPFEISILNKTGEVLYTNHVEGTVLSIDENELSTFWNTVSNHDQSSNTQSTWVQNTLKTVTLCDKNENHYTVEYSHIHYKNQDCYLRIIQQINEEKSEAIRLEEQNLFLTSIFEAVSSPIIVFDVETKEVLLANKAAIDNCKNKEFGDLLIHCKEEECTVDSACCTMNEVIATKRTKILHKKIRAFDNTDTTYQLFMIPLADRNGEVTRIIEYLVDSTSASLSEEMVQVLSKAVEESPVSIVITDADANIEYVNPQFTSATEYSFDEVKGENPRILKSEYYDSAYYSAMWDKLSAGENWYGEFCNKKKNGDIYWEQASISSIKDEKGKIIHYIAVKEDITQRKAQESELVTAKIMAEKTSSIKSEFLANLSHDIKMPLTTILDNAHNLKNKHYDDQTDTEIKFINESAQYLLKLTNDIFDFSELDSRKLRIMHSNFKVEELLATVLSMFKKQEEEKKIIIHKEITEKVPLYINGDELRIKQILTNLVSNAVKFTNFGSVMIEADYNEGRLVLKVTDTGIGISEEMREEIFSPFIQEDDSKKKYAGPGLGLTIAKKLIDLMRGTITVDSKVGIGSCFTVTLPLKGSQDADEAQITATRSVTPIMQLHVGIWEPSDVERNYLIENLKRYHIDIIDVYHADNIYELIYKKKIEILLVGSSNTTEWTDLLDRLQSNILTSHIPVVLCSTVASLDLVYEKGVFDYIPKPVDEGQLYALLLNFNKFKRNIRTVYILEDELSMRKTYRNYLYGQKQYIVYSFDKAEEILAKIDEGKTPDLLLADLFMQGMDGFELIEEIHNKRNRKDITIIAITGKTLTLQEKEMLQKHTLNILDKNKVNLYQIMSAINDYFSFLEEHNDAMVQKWLLHFEKDEVLTQIFYEGLLSLPIKMENLHEAIISRDIEKIQFLSHDLKGLTGNLNMIELYTNLQIVNDIVRENPVLYQKLRDHFYLAVSYLRRIPLMYFNRENTIRKNKQNQAVRILLVEDNVINQRLITTVLEQIDIRCDVAYDGENALKKLETRHYDVVLLDMQMPVMDGLETLKHIRENPRIQDIYVIAVTAHSKSEDIDKYLTAGCDDFIAKPIQINEFKTKLLNLLTR